MTDLDEALLALRARVHARVEALLAAEPAPTLMEPLKVVPDQPSTDPPAGFAPPSDGAQANVSVPLSSPPWPAVQPTAPRSETSGASVPGVSDPLVRPARPVETSGSMDVDDGEMPESTDILRRFFSAANRLLGGFSPFNTR